jgi:predicted dehydrogenase
MKAGFDVYCEKPLAWSVCETRTLIETAAKHKRVTQMGTQIHSGGNYRRVVELIQGGAIGKVTEVHVWVPTSYHGGDKRQGVEVPKHVNYDLWLGPAPERPFHPAHFHFDWRGWWDFGGGATSDMACHHMDLPFWALGLTHPTKVSAEGPELHPDSAPGWLIAHYDFPARGDQPGIKLHWYANKLPKLITDGTVPKWNAGTLFVGEKGMLIADYGNRQLLPVEKFKGFMPPKQTIPDSIGHHKEWFEAIRTRGTTTCNFAYSGTLTEAVLLANVAYRSGETITWEPKEMKLDSKKAEQYLGREFRKGWEM